jgi:hypothetical protein
MTERPPLRTHANTTVGGRSSPAVSVWVVVELVMI